jgi:dienelactone hydrolase
MSIKIECPVCKGAFAAPEEAAGRQVSCPKCGQKMLIPEPSEAAGATTEAAAERPADQVEPAANSLADLVDDELANADPLGSSTGDPLGVAGKKGGGGRTLPVGGFAGKTGNRLRDLAGTYWLPVTVGLLGLVILFFGDAVLGAQTGGAGVGAVPFWFGKLIGLVGIGIAIHGVILKRQKPRAAAENVVESYGGQGLAYVLILIYVLGAFLAIVGSLQKYGGWELTESLVGIGIGLAAVVIGSITFAEIAKRFGMLATAGWTYLALFGVVPLCMLVLTLPISSTVEWAVARASGRVKSEIGEPWPEIGERSRVPLPGFPSPERFIRVDGEVHEAEVYLDVPVDTPGHENRLRILMPGLDHPGGTLPCVLMAPRGTAQFAGAKMTGDDEQDQLEFAKRGFVVVGYNVDEPLPDEDPRDLSERQLRKAYLAFRAARAGLINGRNALEYVLQEIPEVDPDRVYTAGSGSGGTLALLMAAHDPRIKGCGVYGPIVKPGYFREKMENKYQKLLPGCLEFLRYHSPGEHTDRIRCPVMIYHHRQDPLATSDDSSIFKKALERQGVTVKEFADGHGDADFRTIDTGRPWAVDALAKQAGLKPIEDQVAVVVTPPTGNGGSKTTNNNGNGVQDGNGKHPFGNGGSHVPPPPPPPDEEQENKWKVVDGPITPDVIRDYLRHNLIETAISEERSVDRLRRHRQGRRMTIGLRWGMGVFFVGQSAAPVVSDKTAYARMAGALGQQLAIRLQERIDKSDFGAWPAGDDPRLREIMFGYGKASDMEEGAKRMSIDAYILLTLTDEPIPGAGRRFIRRCNARLYDARGVIDIVSFDQVSSTQLNREGFNLVNAWVDEAMKKIDELYRLERMPRDITAEFAKGRAASLATASPPTLENVIELQYYRGRKLLGDDDAAAALSGILGVGLGRKFIDGDADTRRKILKQFEP